MRAARQQGARVALGRPLRGLKVQERGCCRRLSHSVPTEAGTVAEEEPWELVMRRQVGEGSCHVEREITSLGIYEHPG